MKHTKSAGGYYQQVFNARQAAREYIRKRGSVPVMELRLWVMENFAVPHSSVMHYVDHLVVTGIVESDGSVIEWKGGVKRGR